MSLVPDTETTIDSRTAFASEGRHAAPTPLSPVPAEPDHRRLPPANTLIEPIPIGRRMFADLEALADRLALLLQGRGFQLRRSKGCFADTATFTQVSVYATGAVHGDDQWIAGAVLHSPDGIDEDLDRLQSALEAAMRRRG